MFRAVSSDYDKPANHPHLSTNVRPRSSEKVSSWRMFASSSPWTWQICWSLTWKPKCNPRPVENLDPFRLPRYDLAICFRKSFPQPKGVTKVLSLEGSVAPCVRILMDSCCSSLVVWLDSSIIEYWWDQVIFDSWRRRSRISINRKSMYQYWYEH